MSWINRTLGEILTFQNGRAFKKAEWSDEGLPIIRIANLSRKDAPFNHFKGEFEDKIFIQNGDLIFSWSGSLKVEVWDRGEALLNQHLFKVGNRIELNPTWRYYLLLNCIDVLSSKMTGATLQHVTKKELEATAIKVPPLDEQERIVEVLDEAFAAIDKAKANIERNITNARELFQSRLNDIFSNPSEDWVEQSLDELGRVQSGGTPSRGKSAYWNDGVIEWYSSRELNQEWTLPSKEKITIEGLENSNAKLFSAGSLLIGIYDTAAMKMSILTEESAFNQAIVGVEFDKNIDDDSCVSNSW